MLRSRCFPWFAIPAVVLVLRESPAQAAPQNAVPRFERGTCAFPLPAAYPQDLARECGYLTVPEVRGRANGRTFRLAVVAYRAKEPDGSPPLLLLHGGPGGVGGTRFVWGEMQFPLVRRRDVVVFDMRGVGASEPRLCPEFEEQAEPAFNLPTRREWEQGYRAAVRRCVASLDAEGFDRSAYGADVSAADAIDLRRALGYTTWDVYGVSYGGLVAQELLRRDPRGTHAAVLVSTVSPGPDYAAQFLGYQPHLERILAGCAAQPTCRSAFPTLEEDFYALYDELSGTPVEVPAAGASPPRTVLVNGERFLMRIRSHFGQQAISRLPLLISELRRGDRDAAFRRLVGNGQIGAWDALSHLVGCNEYGATYREAVAARRPKIRPAFRAIADDFREHCDLWLSDPPRQADQRPIASQVPTLVVHGEYDPMDIEAMQRRITARLEHAYTFTFPGETHAFPPVGCHGAIVQQFLENPTRAPDASCITRMRGIQFRTSFDPSVTLLITATGGGHAPFTGTWEAPLLGGPDSMIELEIDGSVVRGTVLPQWISISDGRIDGTTLSFKVKSPGGARTITLTGRLQGDGLSFTRDVEIAAGGASGGAGLFGAGGLRTFVAKRVP